MFGGQDKGRLGSFRRDLKRKDGRGNHDVCQKLTLVNE